MPEKRRTKSDEERREYNARKCQTAWRRRLSGKRLGETLLAEWHLSRRLERKGEDIAADPPEIVSLVDFGEYTIEYRGGGFYGVGRKEYPQYGNMGGKHGRRRR